MAEIDNIPEMRPSFDNIRRHDENEMNIGVHVTYALLWVIRLIGNSKKS